MRYMWRVLKHLNSSVASKWKTVKTLFLPLSPAVKKTCFSIMDSEGAQLFWHFFIHQSKWKEKTFNQPLSAEVCQLVQELIISLVTAELLVNSFSQLKYNTSSVSAPSTSGENRWWWPSNPTIYGFYTIGRTECS